MRWIVARSLHFRWLVIFLAATFMAFSLAKIPESKVDVFPEFAPPQVEIQTIALGNSTAEVEIPVTVPIEEALNGLPGLAGDALEVSGPAVVDPAHLREGNQRDTRSSARAGACLPGVPQHPRRGRVLRG